MKKILAAVLVVGAFALGINGVVESADPTDPGVGGKSIQYVDPTDPGLGGKRILQSADPTDPGVGGFTKPDDTL